MIGTLFTIKSKVDPTKFVIINDHTDPENLIALQKYPSMEVDIRNDEINREGQHGVWDFFSFYGKRVFVFEGVIIGEDEDSVTTLKKSLDFICQLPAQPLSGDDGTVLIQWTDPNGKAWESEAKISSAINYGRDMHQKFRLNFMLVLKAPDPLILSQETIEVDGVRGYPMGGFMLPFTVPFVIGVSYINKFEVDNDGTIPADITFRMFGSAHFPITNPRISNITTGEFMQVDISLADETEYIEINTKTGEVLDQDGVDQSGNIHVGSTFPRLAVGTNELFYTSTESADSNAPPITGLEPDEIIQTEHRDQTI
jgi:hypothetical protein